MKDSFFLGHVHSPDGEVWHLDIHDVNVFEGDNAEQCQYILRRVHELGKGEAVTPHLIRSLAEEWEPEPDPYADVRKQIKERIDREFEGKPI